MEQQPDVQTNKRKKGLAIAPCILGLLSIPTLGIVVLEPSSPLCLA